MNLSHRTLLGLFLGTLFSSLAFSQVQVTPSPKLVLTLVIDQFRADTLKRFDKLLLPARDSKDAPGGFRFLMEEGAYYPLAEYGQLQNMTCVGHATILSGAYSYNHGIPINQWMDRETGKAVYCVEDPSSPLVGANREGRGVSPKNFIGTTLGDEIKNSGFASKSIAIALKDRSAILLGGYRNDLALWFDNGRWVSSQFYLPEKKLPEWMNELNARVASESTQPYIWDYARPKNSPSLMANEDIVEDKWVKAIGREFPHTISRTDTAALMTPYATQLTLDATLAALKANKLGQGQGTDMLAVSFSAHDFLVHTFGPNSPELESLTLDEDKALGRLFSEIDRTVGLKNTIIVLTADHGGANNPDWLKKKKLDAGRLGETQIVEQAEAFLKKKFGSAKSGRWVHGSQDYNLYLNNPAFLAKGIDPTQAADELAKFFREGQGKNPAVAEVFSAREIETNTRRTGPFLDKLISQTWRKDRNGDVILIPKPNYLPPENTTGHYTGYSYDRYVPLFIYGEHIKAGTFAEKAEIVDIAPTLAFLLGTTPPAGSEGRVLSEIFKAKTDLTKKR